MLGSKRNNIITSPPSLPPSLPGHCRPRVAVGRGACPPCGCSPRGQAPEGGRDGGREGGLKEKYGGMKDRREGGREEGREGGQLRTLLYVSKEGSD